jgi:hypothetical protein
MKKPLSALAVVLLAGALVSGCGDDGSSPGDQPSGTQTTKDDGGGLGY